MNLKPPSQETAKSLVLAWVGTIVFFVGLGLPLFRANFSPPGGSEVLDGHRFTAFRFAATGLQFAHAAPTVRLSTLIGLLGAGIVARTAAHLARAYTGKDLAGLHVVSSGLHAIGSGVIALAWLALLSVLILLSGSAIVHPAVPLGGASGILKTFEHPLSPGPTFETPYLHVSLALGMLVMIVGIVLCLVSLGPVAGVAFVLYLLTGLIVNVVHSTLHQPTVDSVCQWLRTHFFYT